MTAPGAGRTAVVTGAARGLGAEIAAQLRDSGYRVVAADVIAPSGDGPVPGIERRLLDVTDPEACRALARDVSPHVWVNNAGVLGPGDAATQPDELVARVVAVNVLGVMHGTRAAVEVMRERDGGRGEGHVITVGSLASWVPVPGETVYGATKAAALSFTLGLLGELRAAGVTGVRLSVLCPDGMLTPMITETLHDDAVALSFSGTRLVTVQEVAARAVRLLERPRPIASVPRWRGAQVRVFGAVPDLVLRALPVFTAMGRAQQRKVRARLGAPEQAQPAATPSAAMPGAEASSPDAASGSGRAPAPA